MLEPGTSQRGFEELVGHSPLRMAVSVGAGLLRSRTAWAVAVAEGVADVVGEGVEEAVRLWVGG